MIQLHCLLLLIKVVQGIKILDFEHNQVGIVGAQYYTFFIREYVGETRIEY